MRDSELELGVCTQTAAEPLSNLEVVVRAICGWVRSAGWRTPVEAGTGKGSEPSSSVNKHAVHRQSDVHYIGGVYKTIGLDGEIHEGLLALGGGGSHYSLSEHRVNHCGSQGTQRVSRGRANGSGGASVVSVNKHSARVSFDHKEVSSRDSEGVADGSIAPRRTNASHVNSRKPVAARESSDAAGPLSSSGNLVASNSGIAANELSVKGEPDKVAQS